MCWRYWSCPPEYRLKFSSSRRYIKCLAEGRSRVGYVHNVVFTNGALAEPDGTLKIYYGGADTNMNVATAKIQDLIVICLEDSSPALG